ncbi:uncharacterized protein SCHCODRAFT_02637933 [Schizophyllum commune H4-8]|uniref:uncharacterized protein n=1 Tax=Schizophyllum commune (strain H4-8 / FGSC 9210) TaxID=578458 RepID=UPI002160D980|nr:uncharacterized protein SCHCODRAFT_02637933 [Schizophyllum commune H4-8]KAI5888860.1 hypothetical protein SCHCODRAFT_02637933 [Schizophyllum commune H4-8]
MLLTPPGLAPPSHQRPRIERPLCTRECARGPSRHCGGRTGGHLAVGDIRITYISLLAPFYKILDDNSWRSKVRQPSRRSSTVRSRSVASPRSRQSTIASPSCASTTNGPKKRPCIVANVGQSSAEVCIMGTFEGAFVDKIHKDLRPHLAILVSRKSKHKGDWLQDSKMRHLHSQPEWYQSKGNVQYIVPLMHDISLDDIKDRWLASSRQKINGAEPRSPDSLAVDPPPEGYYMDERNLLGLYDYAEETARQLKYLSGDRAYRRRLRRILDEKMATSKEPDQSNASVKTFDSYAPSIDSVLSHAAAPSIIENTPSTPEEPSRWRASLKRMSTALSMTSTSIQTTAGKRCSVSDDQCPKTPKAAKQGFDTSSIQSKISKRPISLKESPKANILPPSIASPNQFAALTCQ